MLTNYCDLIRLNNFIKKVEIHKELLTIDHRFSRNYSNVDIGEFKRHFEYEKTIDDSFKKILKSNLLKDINTLKQELGLKEEENELAFSELILRQ